MTIERLMFECADYPDAPPIWTTEEERKAFVERLENSDEWAPFREFCNDLGIEY